MAPTWTRRTRPDLGVVAAWTIAAYGAVAAQVGWFVQPLLALPAAFLFPGYAALCVFYPGAPLLGRNVRSEATGTQGDGGPGVVETALLSVVVSLVVTGALAIGVGASPLHAYRLALPTAVALAVLGLTAFAVRRHAMRARSADDDAAGPSGATPGPVISRIGGLPFVLALSAIAVVALFNTGGGTPFTTLAIVQGEGGLQPFQTTFDVGADPSLRIDVANHEGRTLTYNVTATLARYADDPAQPAQDGAVPLSTSQVVAYVVALEDGQRDRRPLAVALDRPGLWRVDAVLRVEPGTTEHRRVFLWLQVPAPAA